MSVQTFVERYLPLIERELEDALRSEPSLSEYYGMMQYHMGWLDETLQRVPAAVRVQGKRLRPVLCLLCSEAVGGQIEQALPAGAAIELVHNFSLIHDDIEDRSPTRRHRPTVWKLWGVAQAVNCGDGMYTKAMLKLGQLAERGVPLQRVHEAQRAFAETCLVLTEGQYLDMTFETRMDVDLDSYLRMIGGKSAALIACCARLGALLGGASREVVCAYAQFGENLGMAFQVVDDILGIWGAEGETGKSVLSDIQTRKKTLPVVYALDDPDLRALYAKEMLGDDDVARVVTILEESGARDYAEGMAESYSRRAIESLDQTGGDSPAHRAIGELARSLLARRS
jgi:geranylgeranyl diphosphate synthase type I